MDELTLKIDHGDETSLPTAIIDGPLSLSEIGALFFVSAIASGDAGFDHPRMSDPAMGHALRALREKGVFDAKFEGKNLNISVDLDKAIGGEK